MRDLKLDNNHDLEVTDDLAFIDDRAEVLQSVNIRILFIRFEWPYNYLMGIPWTTGMFDIRVPIIQKETFIIETILGTVGVRKMTTFVFNIDRDNKGALVTYEAKTIFGNIQGGASV